MLGLLCALLVAPAAHSAPPERFDVQLFRPYGGALDLARVAQSQPVAHGSLVGSAFLHHMLDPLVLVPVGGQGRTASLVGSRLQLEGPVRPTVLGDIRPQGKLAIPGLRRPPGQSGL
jgi:hypothetical protein